MKKVRFWMIGIILGCATLQSAYAAEIGQKDNLNSFTNGQPAKIELKDEDRIWLENAIKQKQIRLATEADKKEWEVIAAAKKRPIHTITMDIGRTYLILKPIGIPRDLSGDIVFIVGKQVPFPNPPNNKQDNGSPIYDIDTGGHYQLGDYDDGETVGVGIFPVKLK